VASQRSLAGAFRPLRARLWLSMPGLRETDSYGRGIDTPIRAALPSSVHATNKSCWRASAELVVHSTHNPALADVRYMAPA
jgi:hypothetical protein